MIADPERPRKVPSAARVFGGAALVFLMLLGALVVLVASDHGGLLGETGRLKTQDLPASLERLRLVRNLEALRFEGERVVNDPGADVRQQAHFVAELIVSNPAVRDDGQCGELAAEVGRFLERARGLPPGDPQTRRDWERLSRALSVLADRVTADSVGGVTVAADRMTALARSASAKLFAALALASLAMLGLMLLVTRMFVVPLQRIDHALAGLERSTAPPAPPRAPIREIAAIDGAIGRLHAAIRENERNRADLEALATRDPLTGLRNRRSFMDDAGEVLARAQRYGRRVTVGMMDLDHFKQVNDSHGHAAGDAALQCVGALVRETLRDSDLHGRVGGEEFAFLCPETTPEEAEALANRLRRRLEASPTRTPDGQEVRLTISIGLADASSISLEEALRAADEALYRAKRDGRNQVAAGAPVNCDDAPADASSAPPASS